MNTIYNQTTNYITAQVGTSGVDIPEFGPEFTIPPWGSVKIGHGYAWSEAGEMTLLVNGNGIANWQTRQEVTTVVTSDLLTGYVGQVYKDDETKTPESEMLSGIGQGINYGIGIFAIGFIMFLIKRHPMAGGPNVERDL